MDTSALAKRYIPETGSAWVTAQVNVISGNVVLIAEVTTVELCSAFARRQRLNQLSPADALQRRVDFLIDVEIEYLSVPVTNAVFLRARDLVAKHPLRTLDAIQLSCALQGASGLGEPLVFVSADVDLLNAAIAEGFAVDNPLSHP